MVSEASTKNTCAETNTPCLDQSRRLFLMFWILVLLNNNPWCRKDVIFLFIARQIACEEQAFDFFW